MKIFRKEHCDNGRRHIYFCGVKIASYCKKRHNELSENNGKNNVVSISNENVKYHCNIIGDNNTIQVDTPVYNAQINISIYGSNNKIHIVNPKIIHNLCITIGNTFAEVNDCEIFIDEDVTIVEAQVIIEQHACKLHIGKCSLLSKNILFRLGEMPHLVFDSETHEYIDTPADLILGDHVWICEGATILKKSKVGNNCIIATKAVVTKDLNVDNALIAGNPAQIRKKNIYWAKSYNGLNTKQDEEYKRNFEKYIKQYGEPSTK